MAKAKTLSRDIGGATYNAFNSNAPAVVGDTGMIQALGAGIQGYQNIRADQAQETLVGPEGTQVPGLEGLGEARVAPSEEFDMDKALNLRQIKRAREQGLINETQARLKVGQAIRSVAVDFPGQEDSLRKRASTYFGKFGEGDLTLTKSATQTQQEQIFVQSFLKPGVAAGFIDPLDPFSDKEGQADWQKYIHDSSVRKQTRDIIQTQAETGKATGLDVANTYVLSDVSDDIASGLHQLMESQKKGEAITDPLEIKGLFNAQKTRHKQILRSRLSRIKGMTSTQKKEALTEVDNAYKDLDSLIDDGSLIKMLEQRQSLLTTSATVYGAGKFPQLFAAEKVSPGIGSSLLKMSDTFGRMKNDASRKAYIDRQPPMMRNFIRQTLDDPMSVSNILSEAMLSNTVPGNDFLDSLFLNVAKDGMGSPHVKNGEGESFKEQSIAYVLKNAPSIQALEDLNTPKVSPIIRGDKRKLAMLTNKFVAHEATVLPTANLIVNEGRTTGRSINILFDFNAHKFTLDVEVDTGIATGPESVPHLVQTEESDIVDRLNILYNTIDYYGVDLGIKPIEWVTKTLKSINKPIEEKKEE